MLCLSENIVTENIRESGPGNRNKDNKMEIIPKVKAYIQDAVVLESANVVEGTDRE